MHGNDIIPPVQPLRWSASLSKGMRIMRRTSHSNSFSSASTTSNNSKNKPSSSFSSTGVDNLARKLAHAIKNGSSSSKSIRKVRFARKKVEIPISIAYTPEEKRASFYQERDYEKMRSEARVLSAASTKVSGDPQHANLESSYDNACIMAVTIYGAFELASALEQETVMNHSLGLGAWSCCEGGTYRGYEEFASTKYGLERRKAMVHARTEVLQFSKQQSTPQKSRGRRSKGPPSYNYTDEEEAEIARLYHQASLPTLIFARMVAEADHTAAL